MKTIMATIVAGTLLASGAARAQQPGAVITEFSGSAGTTTTPMFESQGNWYLRWSSPGAGQAYITIQTPDGRKLDEVSGNGRDSIEPFPGQIRLNVASPNPWTIQILRADP